MQSSSDVILLQEWWFDENFSSVFDSITGDQFDRVSERRPDGISNNVYTWLKQDYSDGPLRDDGMCCLVNKKGKLDLVKSEKVLTGPQRIAQIVQCKEKCDNKRDVFIANTHLSFPRDEDSRSNDRRQAYEANLIQRALSKASRKSDLYLSGTISNRETLEIICGDFNSEPTGLAASQLESRNFVNCASVMAEQMEVTHFTHKGEEMSADHIFVRVVKRSNDIAGAINIFESNKIDSRTSNGSSSTARHSALSIGYQDPLSLGYIDMSGTQIINVRPADIRIRGHGVISDHKPVTATLRWPKFRSVGLLSDPFVNFSNATMPLDPLSYLCANTGIM